MQSGSHALTGLDPSTDVRQVLQSDRAAAARAGFTHDTCADLVVDVPHTLKMEGRFLLGLKAEVSAPIN